eukprot:9690935-Prorocentrum_lima.AAC.1
MAQPVGTVACGQSSPISSSESEASNDRRSVALGWWLRPGKNQRMCPSPSSESPATGECAEACSGTIPPH